MITLSLFQAEVLTALVTAGLALAFAAGYIHAIDKRKVLVVAKNYDIVSTSNLVAFSARRNPNAN